MRNLRACYRIGSHSVNRDGAAGAVPALVAPQTPRADLLRVTGCHLDELVKIVAGHHIVPTLDSRSPSTHQTAPSPAKVHALTLGASRSSGPQPAGPTVCASPSNSLPR